MNLLRDAMLSFCPEAFRHQHRPTSPSAVITCATVLGLIQFALGSFSLVERYRHFFITRAHLWAQQMNGRPEWVQSGGAAIITLEFFLYPLSLLLLYLLLEGFLRFAAGITASEVVPSLPVVLLLKSTELMKRKRDVKKAWSTLPDRIEVLPDQHLRVASALPKPGWNANITIAIDDHWFEIEREMTDVGPHPWVYVLRPAPMGKVIRKVERYEVPGDLSSS